MRRLYFERGLATSFVQQNCSLCGELLSRKESTITIARGGNTLTPLGPTCFTCATCSKNDLVERIAQYAARLESQSSRLLFHADALIELALDLDEMGELITEC
jgi:hypothetical protein